jgi:hypothetical protein
LPRQSPNAGAVSGNIVISPLSIGVTLATGYAAPAGETADKMARMRACHRDPGSHRPLANHQIHSRTPMVQYPNQPPFSD